MYLYVRRYCGVNGEIDRHESRDLRLLKCSQRLILAASLLVGTSPAVLHPVGNMLCVGRQRVVNMVQRQLLLISGAGPWCGIYTSVAEFVPLCRSCCVVGGGLRLVVAGLHGRLGLVSASHAAVRPGCMGCSWRRCVA